MIKVSLIPPVPGLAGNAIFEERRTDCGPHRPNVHWLDPYAALYKMAAGHNVSIATEDILPRGDANVVVHMAQPASRADPVRYKRLHPGASTIYLMIETALGASYTVNPQNTAGFDAVITSDTRYAGTGKYVQLLPRAYFRDRITTGPPFARRKIGCLVGTDRGPIRFRSGLLTMLKGWKFSLADWYDYMFCPGELITYRTSIGREFSKYPAGSFELFGEGWEAYPETRDSFHTPPAVSTLSYVGDYRFYFALENHAASYSLISERIWDALWAGSVPVYRGNTRIGEYVPPECFIDASLFGSPRELLDHLIDMPETEWCKYHEAGRDFVHGKAVEQFLPEAFASRFLDVVRQLVS